MQDGATPHTANVTVELLKQKLADRVFPQKNGWVAHSPDLNFATFSSGVSQKTMFMLQSQEHFSI